MSQDSLLGLPLTSSLENYLTNSPMTQELMNDVLNQNDCQHMVQIETKDSIWEIQDEVGRKSSGFLDMEKFEFCVSPNEIQNNYADEQYIPAIYIEDQPLNNPPIPESGIVPTNTNFPGEYNFGISFEQQPEKTTKSTSWTYSDSLDKLFVVHKKACPVKFRVDENVPIGCYIRALPLFTKAEHLQEPVRRCPNHSAPSDTSNVGHCAPEHLVRCGAQSAKYQCCPNGRLSVVVPYESPQAGSQHTTYLYEFMCYNSCVGGLNRRPMQVVFTLEKDGNVIGRRRLPVRICACPGRDRKAEEKSREKMLNARSLSRQASTTKSVVNEVVSVVPSGAKRRRVEEYTLKVKNAEHYELLKQILQSLELAALVTPDILAKYRAQNSQDDLSRPSTSRTISIPVCSEWEQATMPPVQHVGLQNGSDIDLTSSPNTMIPFSQACNTSEQKFSNVKGWLACLGLEAYTDKFYDRGYMTMKDLDKVSLQDLDEMKIGDAHRNVLWKSLVEYRIKQEPSYSQSQSSQASNASDQSVRSVQRRFTVTRFRYTHKFDFCNDDDVEG